MTSTCASGSISSMASATASSSSEASTPARSGGASWSRMSARSAGWSSASPLWGTRSFTDAIDDSTGSTSSQSMYRSGIGRRRPRASVRNGPSKPSRRIRPAAPDIHRDQVERALDLVEPQVVDAHHACARRCPRSGGPAGPCAAGSRWGAAGTVRCRSSGCAARAPGLVQRLDRRPGQEDAPPRGRDDQAGDRRVAVADGDDEVVHLADGLALPVAHGAPDDPAQVQHLPPRGPPRPARGWWRARCARLPRQPSAAPCSRRPRRRRVSVRSSIVRGRLRLESRRERAMRPAAECTPGSGAPRGDARWDVKGTGRPMGVTDVDAPGRYFWPIANGGGYPLWPSKPDREVGSHGALRAGARRSRTGPVEYALVLALIAIAVLLAITFVGGALIDLFHDIGTTIDNVT